MIDDAAGLRAVLAATRTIAVVGLSAKWHRPSYFAAQYMQQRGYTIVPVNPAYDEVLGQRCYPSLRDIPVAVDMVDCFRRSEEMLALAEEAIAIGAKTLWLQLGVINPAAVARAEAAGMDVVMDRCVKIEYARLFGGLGWFGVNTGVISSRRPVAPPALSQGVVAAPVAHQPDRDADQPVGQPVQRAGQR
ncbi:MAG: CoA-binding protein [Rhodocyclaceae bacterium]|nr:CoA-binding protein [Rhodocyclaceae bacterium]MCB1963571.1 CoA-binding protein [Rhodocyclaceae bacterium]